MSNVIRPEQLKSSMTPNSGDIPVIDDSTSLVLPGDLIFSASEVNLGSNLISGQIRLYPTIINSDIKLELKPNGSSDTSSIRFLNSSSNIDYGYVDLILSSNILNILGSNSGSGTTPTIFQINGNVIYHQGNSGSGNGQNSDMVDGVHSTTIVQTNVSKTITVQHTFNTDTALAPFILGANSQNQKVTGLTPEKIWDAGTSTAVIASSNGVVSSVPIVNGSGVLKVNASIELGVPATIKASSTVSTLTLIVKNTSEYGIVVTPPTTNSISGATANIHANKIISTIATGTAPIIIASTTMVSNLNSDMIDGFNISRSLLNLGVISLTPNTNTSFDVTVSGTSSSTAFIVTHPGSMNPQMILTTEWISASVVRVYVHNSSPSATCTVSAGTWYVTSII